MVSTLEWTVGVYKDSRRDGGGQHIRVDSGGLHIRVDGGGL